MKPVEALPPTVTRCRCGWELPLSVFAYPNEVTGDEDDSNKIPNTHVALVCPRCKRGHAFFDADATATAGRV